LRVEFKYYKQVSTSNDPSIQACSLTVRQGMNISLATEDTDISLEAVDTAQKSSRMNCIANHYPILASFFCAVFTVARNVLSNQTVSVVEWLRPLATNHEQVNFIWLICVISQFMNLK